MQKRAITDLSAPSGSRDILLQSQEFEQNRRRHFIGFQPHFHINMTSQTQSGETMTKWKCNISGVFCSICLNFCKLSELSKGISLDFKFCWFGNQNKNNKQLFKTKDYCFLTIRKAHHQFFLKNDITCSIVSIFEKHFRLNNRPFVFH